MQIVSLVCHGYCANKSRYSYYTCTFLGNFVLTGLFKHIFWGNRGTDQIRDVLKAPSLLAITIDSQRLLPQRLKTIIPRGAFQYTKMKCIGIKVPKGGLQLVAT